VRESSDSAGVATPDSGNGWRTSTERAIVAESATRYVQLKSRVESVEKLANMLNDAQSRPVAATVPVAVPPSAPAPPPAAAPLPAPATVPASAHRRARRDSPVSPQRTTRSSARAQALGTFNPVTGMML
jgi:hypothetical protein